MKKPKRTNFPFEGRKKNMKNIHCLFIYLEFIIRIPNPH